MANQWFKFYGGEYIGDLKMDKFSAPERSCMLTLFCYASIQEDEGIIENLTEENLMLRSGIKPNTDEWNNTLGVLKKFKNEHIVTIDNDLITVTNWKKRQERATTPYERVKKFREKKRSETNCNENDNADDNDRIEENRIEENRYNTLWIEEKEKSFKSFWEEYPKTKRNEAKEKARKKFLIGAKDSLELSRRIEHLKNQKTTDRKWLAGFIPNMSTYLNQKRWDMEIEVEKGSITKHDVL